MNAVGFRTHLFNGPMNSICAVSVLVLSVLASGCSGPVTERDRPPGVEPADATNDYTAVVEPGVSVHFLGISPEESVPLTPAQLKDLSNVRVVSINDRSWFPDGAPYDGPELRGSNSFMARPAEPNTQPKYLAFAITSPIPQRVDVYGYVPERLGDAKPALTGADEPTRIDLWKDGSTLYRTPIVVSSRSNSYFFGIATGPQTVALSTRKMPPLLKKLSAAAKSPGGETGIGEAPAEVAKGPWGRLLITPPPKETGLSFSKHTLPELTVSIEDRPDPATLSYEVRAYDAGGNSLSGGALISTPHILRIPLAMAGQIDRIDILTRPYKFVEFKNVHFSRDEAKWGHPHWGAEGNSTIAKAPGIAELDGILRPRIEPNPEFQSWSSTQFFANDGQLWREYPDPDALGARYSTPDWPDQETLVGLIRLDPEMIARARNVRVQVFPSSSSIPGQGLGPEIKGLWNYQFDREISQAQFARPKTTYVQFAVRPSTKQWDVVGRVAPPTEELVKFTDEDRAQIAKGVGVGRHAFSLILRANGSLAYFYSTPADPNVLKENLLTWDRPGSEVRVIAELKSGGEMELHNNAASGSGDTEFMFNLAGDSQPYLDAFRSKVWLKDIARFRLERRGYGEPVYLVAKLPTLPAPLR